MKLIDIFNDLKKECDKRNEIIDKKLIEIDHKNDQIIEHNNNLDEKNKLIFHKRQLAVISTAIIAAIGTFLAFKIPGFVNNLFNPNLVPEVSEVTGSLALSNISSVLGIVIGEALAIGGPIVALREVSKYLTGNGSYLTEQKLIEDDKLEHDKRKNNYVKNNVNKAIEYIKYLGKESSLEQETNLNVDDLFNMYQWIDNLSEYHDFDKYCITKEEKEKYALISMCYVALSDSKCHNFYTYSIDVQKEIMKKVCQIIRATSDRQDTIDRKNRVRRMERYKEEEIVRKK